MLMKKQNKNLKTCIKRYVLTNGSSILVESLNLLPLVNKLNIDPLTNKYWKDGPLQTIDSSDKRVSKFTNKYK